MISEEDTKMRPGLTVGSHPDVDRVRRYNMQILLLYTGYTIFDILVGHNNPSLLNH